MLVHYTSSTFDALHRQLFAHQIINLSWLLCSYQCPISAIEKPIPSVLCSFQIQATKSQQELETSSTRTASFCMKCSPHRMVPPMIVSTWSGLIVRLGRKAKASSTPQRISLSFHLMKRTYRQANIIKAFLRGGTRGSGRVIQTLDRRLVIMGAFTRLSLIPSNLGHSGLYRRGL